MIKREIFEKYIHRIEERGDLSSDQKVRAYYRLFTLILEDLSDDDNINFTSLFSRIAFIGAKERIEGRFLYLMHTLRRSHENNKTTSGDQLHVLQLSRYICHELLRSTYQSELANPEDASEVYRIFRSSSPDVVSFSPIIRGLIISFDAGKKQFSFIDESNGVKEIIVAYDVAHKNEIFTPSLHKLMESIPLPIHINLIDVEHLEDGSLLPRAFVVEPDYLIDVTSIANTFKYYGTEPLEVILNKFRPIDMSIYLLLGNIANFILDEVVNNREISFKELIPRIFQLSPLQISCLDDRGVKTLLGHAHRHFLHLTKVIKHDFKKESITIENVYLEPSFYSRDYGIQGRLDLLHEDSGNHHFDIVELKSGSPFRPNSYGLSVQHYTQTLLYDLIVKSVFKGKRKTSNYILYSKEEDWQLRNAPVLKVQQYEALKTRNDLLLMEYYLANDEGLFTDSIYNRIKPASFNKASGFLKDHIQEFSDLLKNLDDFEKTYLREFARYVAREHRLAKVGEHGLSKSNGLAALWLEDRDEKEDRFSILHSLIIEQNKTAGEIPVITLEKSKMSPELTRFRVGDIVVLYPQGGVRSVLHNQIFKCNIINLEGNRVTLKLRSRQYNQRIFKENKFWSIEGDVMDSSFLSMYRSLYQWAKAPVEIRKKILGFKTPEKNKTTYFYHSDEMTSEQNLLLNKIISSKDYFLLWGPPGTGKTSVMVKHLVRYLMKYTDEMICLVAYTNKAVDEMCKAILDALEGETELFIRIGSSYSCDPKYRPYLLDHSMEQFSRREEILSFLKQKRIIISTVSSLVNRTEIFHLFKMDTIIIDEASQILEPMIVGLLTQFNRFIMIGDHKQLPAVVVQDEKHTRIKSDLLRASGFYNTRNSLFERLYMQALDRGWEDIIGILIQQGRMHQDIMTFSNRQFYEGRLQVIQGIDRLIQPSGLHIPDTVDRSKWEGRMVFVNTDVEEDFSWKTNTHEVSAIVRLLKEIDLIYEANGIEWNTDSVGIITPYRAQISMMSKYIHDSLPKNRAEMISIDTVERFQGGARDIIIISLCTNRMDQMERLVSLSDEGIDRKLNVALTRARERVFIFGNREIMVQDENYASLIDHTYTISSLS